MTLVSERIGQFFIDDHRLEYTEFGSGDRWVILVPGQLMPRRMHQPLARKIAASGAHVVTLDLLGHGRSDRPTDPLAYSMTAFGEQVVALLDHLGADRAVLGGTSTGANVCLEAAVLAPGRVQGLLLEMPVLENALEVGIATLSPLLFLARYAPFLVTGTRWLSRSVPRGIVPFWMGVGLDTLDQRPAGGNPARDFLRPVRATGGAACGDRRPGPGRRSRPRPSAPGCRCSDARRRDARFDPD
jgi:pimeloyl-ACP methyl ester carboxylesterase